MVLFAVALLSATSFMNVPHSRSMVHTAPHFSRTLSMSSGELSEADMENDLEMKANQGLALESSKRKQLRHFLSRMPCNDGLDKRILSIALPAIMNFAILPLVGAVDTAFVGRMDNALALAGQGAANQVFR